VKINHEVLDSFELSRGVIVICSVLMYYAIEIGSHLFLSRSFRIFLNVFDVDLSSLFIVGESSHRV
jgi:uncharacterized membrane protein YhfC